MPQRPIEARDAVAPNARAKQPSASVRARLVLRDATNADVPKLVSIINDAYKAVDWWLFQRERTDEADLRREMAKPGAVSVVGEINGVPVAHVLVWLNASEPFRGAWIGMLAVAPECQGRGIATALVEEAERRMVDGGYNEALLDCVRENGLVGYYQSLGFSVIREERGRHWEATAEWTRVYMSKPLTREAP
jgi:ribosomal protein S18 acetylase RimI-like enzyme